jgi:hypothetical protein
MSYPSLDGLDSGGRVAALLKDLGSRQEFRELAAPTDAERSAGVRQAIADGLVSPRAYMPRDGDADLPEISELHLHDMQVFVQRWFNPQSPAERFLLCWDTGLGKTIAAIQIGQLFARQYASRKLSEPEDSPTVFIIGFTRAIIQAEMLRDPKHGFITTHELAELRRLRVAAAAAAAAGRHATPEMYQYNGYMGTIKRSLTDRARGGYYQFYGYREFASQLFELTPKGEQAGIKISELFQRPQGARGIDPMAVFVRRISDLEGRGLLRVNVVLVGRMRQGLIIADEIHNVYNVHEPNMYGVAIQYVLDVYPPGDAPRALFMSATPMSGSPAEIVDVLNLLVPRRALPGARPVRPGDLFDKAAGRPALKPGALDTITRLCAGRVSFMTIGMAERDPRDLMFPRINYMGAPADGPDGLPIPYLKFVEADVSALQVTALKTWRAGAGNTGMGLPAAADYALYDIVFPGPSGEPLYSSSSAHPITQVIALADKDWRSRNRISVLPGSTATGRSVPVLSGEFLAMPSLAKYSGKYAAFVQAVRRFVKAGPGKMLVSHDRVQVTGVGLIAQILRANGLAPMDEPPVDGTLCSVCGVPMGKHAARQASHAFAPARFGVITGAMDHGAKDRAMSQFNQMSNIGGLDMRVLVGSRVIIEGLNFTSVRAHHILSVPRDTSTLIQILGRSARRGSHSRLASADRQVDVTIWLNRCPPGDASCPVPPDRTKIAAKMADSLVIQSVMRAIRAGAVNSFLPQVEVLENAKPGLKGLDFKPMVSYADVLEAPLQHASYYAYQHAANDMRRVTQVIRVLFSRRPVWPVEELVSAVQAPVVQGQAVNPKYYQRGLIDLALFHLTRPPMSASLRSGSGPDATLVAAHLVVGGQPRRIIKLGRPGGDIMYVAVAIDARGLPVTDIESYIRPEMQRRTLTINLARYTKTRLADVNFKRRLVEFESEYGASAATIANFRSILWSFDASFHLGLLAHICRAQIGGRALSRSEEGARLVYRRYKILVSMAQLRRVDGNMADAVSRQRGRRSAIAPDAAVGFIGENAARIMVGDGARSLPRAAFGVGKRQRENNIAVGYMGDSGHLQFKVREPIHQLGIDESSDSRTLARGAVCETRPRSVQLDLAKRLARQASRSSTSKLRLTPREIAGMISSRVCHSIMEMLLAEEEAARSGKDGMQSGLRWFYIFNDARPTIKGRAL